MDMFEGCRSSMLKAGQVFAESLSKGICISDYSKEDNMQNKYIDIAVEESQNTPERLNDNIEEYLKICDKTLNTYIAKNIDYGDSFAILFDKFGLKSSIIRLHDKLLRLEQLAENDAEVDESVDDTLEDMINYAIMTLIARKS